MTNEPISKSSTIYLSVLKKNSMQTVRRVHGLMTYQWLIIPKQTENIGCGF